MLSQRIIVGRTAAFGKPRREQGDLLAIDLPVALGGVRSRIGKELVPLAPVEREIEIDGSRIRPLDFTARILFPCWELKEGDEDITVMRVIVEGRSGGERKRYTYDLFDRHDPVTGVHSMARTTGYTATVTLRMMAEGLYGEKGVIAPEMIGRRPECVEYMIGGLAGRGVVYRESVETIP